VAASRLRRALRIVAALAAIAFAFVAYVYVTIPDVRVLATTNPTTTAFMEMRAREAEAEGKKLRFVHRWVPYSRISQNLKRAVLVAEDSAFFEHEGLDYAEIRKAVEAAMEKGTEIRGASTLTQQLAKNLYLSPSRDPLRKLRELIITRRLEASLSKARIFELYLNVVEWGDGVWGAEAAARTHFGTSASSLSRDQAALLAGALINPIVYSPSKPPRRLLRRQQIILARMGGVVPPAAEPVSSVPVGEAVSDQPAPPPPGDGDITAEPETVDAPPASSEQPEASPAPDPPAPSTPQ
jgi:monofunctional glycosyltransferase